MSKRQEVSETSGKYAQGTVGTCPDFAPHTQCLSGWGQELLSAEAGFSACRVSTRTGRGFSSARLAAPSPAPSGRGWPPVRRRFGVGVSSKESNGLLCVVYWPSAGGGGGCLMAIERCRKLEQKLGDCPQSRKFSPSSESNNFQVKCHTPFQWFLNWQVGGTGELWVGGLVKRVGGVGGYDK